MPAATDSLKRYPRDLHGYGPTPPNANWPGGAHIAVQFVLNYEEGGENNILHGDADSEAFLCDVVSAAPWPGQRHWNVESMYDYGARAGFWRLHRLLSEHRIGVTVYGVASALMRSPAQVAAMQQAGWEIASHGYKWIEHKDMPPEHERAQIAEAIRLHTLATGERPHGWYTGRCSVNTVDLVSEDGGFAYVSDTYDDDLPYWRVPEGRPQLIIPYSLSTNDMRFVTASGFANGEDYFQYLKDSFDCLYAEGQAGSPKMMSVGLHCRLAGQPGRFMGLKRFIDYIEGHQGVWTPTRLEIARHWAQAHPCSMPLCLPSQMDRAEFVERFGSVFEAAPHVAEKVFDGELGPANDTVSGLHFAFCAQYRATPVEERLRIQKAYTPLDARIGAATLVDSPAQAVGLDLMTQKQQKQLLSGLAAYEQKFGISAIFALKDYSTASLLQALEDRLQKDKVSELMESDRQVERLARLRLEQAFDDLSRDA